MSAGGSGLDAEAPRGGAPTGTDRGRPLVPPPRRLSWRALVGIIVLAAVLVYGIVVTLYALSGRVTTVGDARPHRGGVSVIMTAESVDAVHQRIAMTVHIDASSELAGSDGLSLAHELDVLISPVDGSQTIRFKAGAAPTSVSVDIIAPGEIENWPFDGYRTRALRVLAYTVGDAGPRVVPTSVHMDGYVPGWNIDAALVGDTTKPLPRALSSAVSAVPTIDLRAVRSGSTVAFGIVLLGLMVVMPCLVLFVAVNAYRGRRKIEPSFMSWMGAMLFATIPLRTFLPGSPPIGSWIDYLIVLWVVVALVGGLALYVVAWWRWSTPGVRPS